MVRTYGHQAPVTLSEAKDYVLSGETVRLKREEVFDQFLPLVGENAFGMELHALQREFPVPQAHDDSRPVALHDMCADFEFGGQIVFRNNERVVAGSSHWRIQPAENRLPIMLNAAGLAMHQILGAHDPSSECLAERLMSETHPQYRHFSRKVADQRHADPGVCGCAGPW